MKFPSTPKFRKKPVIVEAMRIPIVVVLPTFARIEVWTRGKALVECSEDRTSFSFQIQTLEGVMTASPGDWIIKGINGEFYPCKPDIFEKTYEPIDNSPTPDRKGDTQ